jgi:hypothetical protein
MRKLTTLVTLLLLLLPAFADLYTRPDIDKDIPLAEAIRRVNEEFPDPTPLTEDEVVAAVQAIRLAHPSIPADIYKTYMRVVKERVLPKDMWFTRMTSWRTKDGIFQVDWKNLRLEGRPATAAETAAMLSSISTNTTVSGGFRIGGFDYRVRARFVSWSPQTHSRSRATEEIVPGVEVAPPNSAPPHR